MNRVHVLMRRYSAVLLLTIFVSVPASGDEPVSGAPLKCEVGPIEKTYGKTQWLVYGCDDERSVVIVAAPLSPARPFVFRFLAQGDGYLLQSKGSGDRDYTTAAFGELKMMTLEDIEALVKLTKTSAQQ
ncbi:MAG: hypothetical protein JSU95_09535 [Betaproteobacteria bacterium]|nr:MAG: hypothetical protein JSU95_09535 [Betaproteobacteria bacterium]